MISGSEKVREGLEKEKKRVCYSGLGADQGSGEWEESSARKGFRGTGTGMGWGKLERDGEREWEKKGQGFESGAEIEEQEWGGLKRKL